MSAIYNEIEPYAADWLGNLIERGHIASGRVELRSIVDLTPADVAGPGQRHFFAGIGGWSYALRLAGIPDDADVWTGSCPCQPFSAAGKRTGTDDERHLWPAWFRLIRECRPPVIFGEQVASKEVIGDQGEGLRLPDEVSAYSSGEGLDPARARAIQKTRTGIRSGPPRPRHSVANQLGFLRGDRTATKPGRRANVGQPVDRSDRSEDRLPLLEHSDRLSRSQQRTGRLGRTALDRTGDRDPQEEERTVVGIVDALGRAIAEESGGAWFDAVQSDLESAGYAVGVAVLPAAGVGASHIRQRLYFVAYTNDGGRGQRIQLPQRQPGREMPDADGRGSPGELGDTAQVGWGGRASSERREERGNATRAGSRLEPWTPCRVGDTGGDGDREHARELPSDEGQRESRASDSDHAPVAAGATRGACNGFWNPCDWIPCTDGVARPVEPGLEPLAHGVSGRVVVRSAEGQAHEYNRAGALAGFGNAIVPELAAVFIEAAQAARSAIAAAARQA